MPRHTVEPLNELYLVLSHGPDGPHTEAACHSEPEAEALAREFDMIETMIDEIYADDETDDDLALSEDARITREMPRP